MLLTLCLCLTAPQTLVCDDCWRDELQRQAPGSVAVSLASEHQRG